MIYLRKTLRGADGRGDLLLDGVEDGRNGVLIDAVDLEARLECHAVAIVPCEAHVHRQRTVLASARLIRCCRVHT